MIDFETLNRKIEEYKNLKATRPRYKKALIEKKTIEFVIHALTKKINCEFLYDEQKKDLEVKIKKNASLLFLIELYIIKCKIKFDMEQNNG